MACELRSRTGMSVDPFRQVLAMAHVSRAGILAAVAVLALWLSAWADEPNIIRSITPPGASPYGLDFVADGAGGGFFYHTDWYTGDVYTIDLDGTASLLFNVPQQLGQPYTYYRASGICFVGDGAKEGAGSLYILEWDRGGSPYFTYVHAFSVYGTHAGTYDISGIVSRGKSITHDGEHFWIIGDASLVECDADFNLVETHAIPWGSGDGGLDYDAVLGVLYNAPVLNQAVCVFEPGSASYTYYWYTWVYNVPSIAVGQVTREYRTLWLMDNSQVQGMIVEIEDAYYATPVEETSWSELKAQYR